IQLQPLSIADLERNHAHVRVREAPFAVEDLLRRPALQAQLQEPLKRSMKRNLLHKRDHYARMIRQHQTESLAKYGAILRAWRQRLTQVGRQAQAQRYNAARVWFILGHLHRAA